MKLFKNINQYFKSDKINAKNIFRIGIFLLPSAMAISLILQLLSILIVAYRNKRLFIKDKWNFPFILSIPFFLISCFINSTNTNIIVDNNFITWIRLFNWIPFFLYFWSVQSFLRTRRERIIIANLLIAGTVPLFFSIITQYFGVYGPFSALNGLIIWYQRDTQPLSGFFSNNPYTSCWLGIILPITIARLRLYKVNNLKTIFFFCFIVISIFIIFLTNSYDSMFGILIGFAFIFFKKNILKPMLSISSLFLIFFFTTKPFQNAVKEIFYSINYLNINNNFLETLYIKISTRLEIFSYNFSEIYQRPFFGGGGSSYYLLIPDGEIYHPHNLFQELAYSYGLLVTFLIASTIVILIFFSFNKIYNERKRFNLTFKEKWRITDKAWFSSFIVLLISQLVDIQYFDARISCVFWLLLAGLREIIREKKSEIPFT